MYRVKIIKLDNKFYTLLKKEKYAKIAKLSLEEKIDILKNNNISYKIIGGVYYFYDKNEKIIKNNKYDYFITITDFILKNKLV